MTPPTCPTCGEPLQESWCSFCQRSTVGEMPDLTPAQLADLARDDPEEEAL